MCVHNEHPTPLALFQLLPEPCDLHEVDSLLHRLLASASFLPQQQLQQLRHEPHIRLQTRTNKNYKAPQMQKWSKLIEVVNVKVAEGTEASCTLLCTQKPRVSPSKFGEFPARKDDGFHPKFKKMSSSSSKRNSAWQISIGSGCITHQRSAHKSFPDLCTKDICAWISLLWGWKGGKNIETLLCHFFLELCWQDSKLWYPDLKSSHWVW